MVLSLTLRWDGAGFSLLFGSFLSRATLHFSLLEVPDLCLGYRDVFPFSSRFCQDHVLPSLSSKLTGFGGLDSEAELP